MSMITPNANVDLRRSRLVGRAETAEKESKYLDFKSAFDPDSTVEWAEVIKDIVAFANSGGGVIVFGVNDDGSTADYDTSRIYNLDAADITNKIEAYTAFSLQTLRLQRSSGTATCARQLSLGAPTFQSSSRAQGPTLS